MMRTALSISLMAVMLVACNLPDTGVPPTSTAEPAGETTQPPKPTSTSGSEVEAPPTPEPPNSGAQPGIAGQEAIVILEPGPGSRVLSPLRLSGVADPAHEQTLVLRGLRPDGSELIAPVPINIMAPLGERGPFEITISFSVSQDEQVFIQVFDQSARDGGVTHLASVAVMLIASGPQSIRPWSSFPEQIVITAPAPGQIVSGGVARIEGIGVASFEGTFVLEIVDADGEVVGSQAVITAAPDMGLPGAFGADVPYSVAEAGPGRVIVRDPSPAFGGEVHLASVEIWLEP